MSANADIVRDKLRELIERPTGYIYRGDVHTLTASADLIDALVAERDEARREREEAVRHQRLNGEEWMARAESAEAEVARLREALDTAEENYRILEGAGS